MVFGATGAAAPGPPSFALGPSFGVCPGKMAKTTAAATAAAASAATPIAPARLFSRPWLLPPVTEDGGAGRVRPGGPAPGEPPPGGPGSRSSEPFDRTAPPDGPGLLGCFPACCQVRARMVWVGESWTRADGAIELPGS